MLLGVLPSVALLEAFGLQVRIGGLRGRIPSAKQLGSTV
jgi:hypothetical protein